MIEADGSGPAVRRGPRRSARLLALVVAAVLLGASGCQWAGYRWDATLNGYNHETNLSAANGVNLVPKFSVAVGWSSPVVGTSNGIVGKTAGGVLWGADRTGTSGCSGSPVVCQPLWTATVNTPDPWVSLHGPFALTTYRAVTNGETVIANYDAVGLSGCSGTPKVCLPGWVTDGPSISGATIGGAFLYVTDGANLRVYDVDGLQGCSGTPRVCTPLWTAPAFFSQGQPMVVGGRVYVIDADGYQVFDAAGTASCSGTPKVCAPLWSANLGAYPATLQGNADWVVASAGGMIQATDAKGVTGCTGTPKVCGPVWTAPVTSLKGRPSIARGKVLLQAGSGQSVAQAYDLAGVASCTTGALPHTCAPVWTRAMGVEIPAAFDTTAVNDVAFFERYDGTDSEVPNGPLFTQALRIADGTVAFSTPDGLGFMPPIVGDGRVYLQNQNGIQVLGQP